MDTSFFQVDNLSISFGGIKALQDVSFTMDRGEIFSVIGPNGAGKTTLFNCISGLYKPNHGNIRFQGKKIDNEKPDIIAKMGIARTFQNFRILNCFPI